MHTSRPSKDDKNALRKAKIAQKCAQYSKHHVIFSDFSMNVIEKQQIKLKTKFIFVYIYVRECFFSSSNILYYMYLNVKRQKDKNEQTKWADMLMLNIEKFWRSEQRYRSFLLRQWIIAHLFQQTNKLY